MRRLQTLQHVQRRDTRSIEPITPQYGRKRARSSSHYYKLKLSSFFAQFSGFVSPQMKLGTHYAIALRLPETLLSLWDHRCVQGRCVMSGRKWKPLHSFRSRAPRFNTVPSHPGVSLIVESTRNLVDVKV
jgi:hypothetical protein